MLTIASVDDPVVRRLNASQESLTDMNRPSRGTRGISNRSRFNNSPVRYRGGGGRGAGPPATSSTGGVRGLRHQPYQHKNRAVREVHFEHVDTRSQVIRRRSGPRRGGSGFRGAQGGGDRYFHRNIREEKRETDSKPTIGFDVGHESVKLPETLVRPVYKR